MSALANLSVLSGGNQSGSVGDPLLQELSVVALDQFGDPVEGAVVRFQVTRGASAGATVNPDMMETDEWATAIPKAVSRK